MKKLYVIKSRGPIYGLDGIVGPLSTPTELNFRDVLTMVNQNYDIYQVNPYDKSEQIKVTKSNINTIKFNISRSRAALEHKKERENLELTRPLNTSVETSKEVKTDVKENKNVDKKVTKPDRFTK